MGPALINNEIENIKDEENVEEKKSDVDQEEQLPPTEDKTLKNENGVKSEDIDDKQMEENKVTEADEEIEKIEEKTNDEDENCKKIEDIQTNEAPAISEGS